jgi:hypothetical protein
VQKTASYKTEGNRNAGKIDDSNEDGSAAEDTKNKTERNQQKQRGRLSQQHLLVSETFQ